MGVHKLCNGPCPAAKVSWPSRFSLRTFSHWSFHITQLQGYWAAPHWSLNTGSPAPARRGKGLQSLFLLPGLWCFLSLELFFVVLISSPYSGVRGIFCTLCSQGEETIQRRALVWAQSHRHYSHTFQIREVSDLEQLNGRFVWVFYYSLWIFAWYCFLYLSDINKTQVTALTSMEFGFDSVQLR